MKRGASEMSQEQVEAEAMQVLDYLKNARGLQPDEAIAVLGTAITTLICHRYKHPRDVAEEIAGVIIDAATQGTRQ